MNLPARNNKTLTLVREIGFDNAMGVGKKPAERIFFLGAAAPQSLPTEQWQGDVIHIDGREIGAHATPEAIAEFIDYWQHQIAAARDYVANGCNSNTMEWAQAPSEPVNRSCEYEQTLLLRFCAWLETSWAAWREGGGQILRPEAAMKPRLTRLLLDLAREEGLKMADVADRWRRQRDMMVKAAREVENAYYIVPQDSARLRAAMDALCDAVGQCEEK